MDDDSQESGSIDRRYAEDALELYRQAIEEGRRTTNRQYELFAETKDSADKLLKLNTLLLTLLLTAFSVAIESERFDVTPFVNQFTMVGVACLLVSIGAYMLAIRPYRQIAGISGNDLKDTSDDLETLARSTQPTPAPDSDFEVDISLLEEKLEWFNWLVWDYGSRIKSNTIANRQKARAVVIVSLFFVYEIGFLTLGVLYAYLESSGGVSRFWYVLAVVAILWFGAVAVFSGIYELFI